MKIESHDGDETRSQLVDQGVGGAQDGARRFLAVNGNKRSITLDLRRPEAVEIVKRLVVARRRGVGELPAAA